MSVEMVADYGVEAVSADVEEYARAMAAAEAAHARIRKLLGE